MIRLSRYAISFACVLVLGGCCFSRECQVQQVAKDWCLVIRASQVIPVYPLTEDLQPGDVFLVQLTIGRQHEIYSDRGFLPLDNHVKRLEPAGFANFYKQSFGAGGPGKELPKFWLASGESGAWAKAPKASFPSYTFSVRRGTGLNLAVPVSGVPIGLSLLGADAATGSITIADARTYGVDTESLHADLMEWAAKNREFVRAFASTEEKKNYLRVVSRVYLAGKIDIALQDASSASGSVSGGVPKPVELLTPSTDPDVQKATIEAYSNNISTLNKMIEAVTTVAEGAGAAAPGGTLKVTAASARSISLVETFERPLVVGYLGFDVQIGPEGGIGPPMPTHAVLSEGAEPSAADFTPVEADLAALIGTARAADETIRQAVAEELKGQFESIYLGYGQSEDDKRALFVMLCRLYIADDSRDGPRHRKLLAALRKALAPASGGTGNTSTGEDDGASEHN